MKADKTTTNHTPKSQPHATSATCERLPNLSKKKVNSTEKPAKQPAKQPEALFLISELAAEQWLWELNHSLLSVRTSSPGTVYRRLVSSMAELILSSLAQPLGQHIVGDTIGILKQKLASSKNLEETFELLKEVALDLDAWVKDCEDKVKSHPSKITTASYDLWMSKVLRIRVEMANIEKDYNSRPSCCHVWQRSRLGEKMAKKCLDYGRLLQNGYLQAERGFLVDKPPETIIEMDAAADTGASPTLGNPLEDKMEETPNLHELEEEEEEEDEEEEEPGGVNLLDYVEVLTLEDVLPSNLSEHTPSLEEEEDEQPGGLSLLVSQSTSYADKVEVETLEDVILPNLSEYTPLHLASNDGGSNAARTHSMNKDVESVIEKQDTHDLFCPNCSSCVTKRVILRRRKRKPKMAQHDEGQATEIVLDLTGIDKEEENLDVESVLEKQDTHDLYCPNCSSCTTRRVVLRRRKKRLKLAEDDEGQGSVGNVGSIEDLKPPPERCFS